MKPDRSTHLRSFRTTSAPPEHARAPEVTRAALQDASDLFGRLLAAAIRNGTERGLAMLEPKPPNAGRPTQLLARAKSGTPGRRVSGFATNDCGARRDKQREAKHALQRDAQCEQAADPLAPLRVRPAIGHFTIMDLGSDSCRFPFGDGPFWFCGATSVPGKPYCAGCIRGLYHSPDPDDEEASAAS
jgi:hypothetical protein